MDELKAASREYYSRLATEATSKVVAAGRYAADADKEQNIWVDVLAKLDFRAPTLGMRVLDIGCGYSNITDLWVKHCAAHGVALTLMDFEPVIEAVKRDLDDAQKQHVELIGGAFPEDISDEFRATRRFDRIVMYSVLHYSSEPMAIVRGARALLERGGKLLIGDVANVNKKGRFVASEAGRAFEAEYRKVPLAEVPVYADHRAFVAANTKGNNAINDELVADVLRESRQLGFDAYVLPQPAGLPFCFTREDLLICRND